MLSRPRTSCLKLEFYEFGDDELVMDNVGADIGARALQLRGQPRSLGFWAVRRLPMELVAGEA